MISPPESLYGGFQPLWQRFRESLDSWDENDASSLLQNCQQRQELAGVWLASEFVATSCIRSPELLRDLIESGDLDLAYEKDHLAESVERFLADSENEEDLHRRLRHIRRREMVRLAWRDLSGFSDLEETMRDLSRLADSCIDQALRFHEQWLTRRFGLPRDEAGNPVHLVVLGLGKLGGMELNYSSDIDLILAYGAGGETDVADFSGAKSISHQEFFIKLGRKIVAALDPITADGFVFRTDLRLRPNGESGPIVLPFAAMEHYYQTHGRDWERYALIKARQVAGDRETGEELLAMLKPFVYRKYLDFGAFDSIREMKGMIERELRKKGIEEDVKLGRGGIREVEFLVQSHQLIRGGRETMLQTSSLYDAFTMLVELGVMDAIDRDQMIESYRFLRNVEHRLQMVADRQTQQLPAEEIDQLRLAWSMGFDDWPQFLGRLNHYRSVIHEQFKSILNVQESADTGEAQNQEIDNLLGDLWNGSLDSDRAEEVLETVGFPSPQNTRKLLQQFREGRLYQAFSGVERDRIDRLIPMALKAAGHHKEAERAVTAFISVIESIGRRSVYLSLLIENPLALKQLLHLCAASPWISRYIGQHPVIMDELLSPIEDMRDRNTRAIRDELERRLGQVEEGDEEAEMNTLREFHHAHALKVAAADVAGVLEVEDVHHSLSRLAEVLLQKTFDQAVSTIYKKQKIDLVSAGVIAYGKFASGELGYHSDLDIVVCFEKPETSGNLSELEYFYSRVGRRLIHLLTARTHAGALYELDMRLRPSGRSGTLVTSLSGFTDYQLKSAWTWEHQALVRAKAVVGDAGFVDQFEAVRSHILCLQRDEQELKRDILSMRQKMIDANCQSTKELYDIKLDQGGIVDIEFLIQYWILRHAHAIPKLVEPRTTSDSVQALIEQNVISEQAGNTLSDAYRTYLRRSLDLKLMDSPVLISQNECLDQREAVMSIWTETFKS